MNFNTLNTITYIQYTSYNVYYRLKVKLRVVLSNTPKQGQPSEKRPSFHQRILRALRLYTKAQKQDHSQAGRRTLALARYSSHVFHQVCDVLILAQRLRLAFSTARNHLVSDICFLLDRIYQRYSGMCPCAPAFLFSYGVGEQRSASQDSLLPIFFALNIERRSSLSVAHDYAAVGTQVARQPKPAVRVPFNGWRGFERLAA